MRSTVNPQTKPIRRTVHLNDTLPGYIRHVSFSRPNAESKYHPTKLLDVSVDFSNTYMPDEVSREHSQFMHYAAHRMHQSKTRRELNKWQQMYLQLRDRIVIGNRKLVYRAVQQFPNMAHSSEDHAADCQIVLIQTVVAFNPWIGIRFSTYSYTCLLRALARQSKRETKQWVTRSVSLDALVDGEPQPARVVTSSHSVGDYRLDEYLRAEHPLLSEREKKVITCRFNIHEQSDNVTLEAVGQQLGLSKERVRQVQASAITKLRKALSVSP
jgi:RNA polymerase sigma factor (sigma-70 family)